MENVVLKWANILEFSPDWVERITAFLPEAQKVEYDPKNRKLKRIGSPMQNLVSYLGYCEIAEKKYTDRGIPYDVFLETARDIRLWSYKYRIQTGEYGLMEINWTHRIIDCTLFRLGRLQFAFGRAYFWFPSCGIYPLNPILEIHIPSLSGKMTPESVDESLSLAEDFFPRYFPEYHYRGFTCGSWLLGKNMHLFLPADSNIRRFADRFRNKVYFVNYCCTHHLYNMGVNRRNISTVTPNSKLQADIKDHIMRGGLMYYGMGALPTIHRKTKKETQK